MQLENLLRGIDARTAQAFVTAAWNLFEALAVQAEQVQAARTPAPRDYRSAGLDRSTPPGGWLAAGELRQTGRRIAEAIATERWLDGALLAIRALGGLGGG